MAVGGFPEGHPATMASLSPRKLSHEDTVLTSITNATSTTPTTSTTNHETAPATTTATTNVDNSTTTNSSMITSQIAQDFIYLRKKIEAGADFILTNFFYEPKVFLEYVRQCRYHGITCPIIPGIKCINI